MPFSTASPQGGHAVIHLFKVIHINHQQGEVKPLRFALLQRLACKVKNVPRCKPCQRIHCGLTLEVPSSLFSTVIFRKTTHMPLFFVPCRIGFAVTL